MNHWSQLSWNIQGVPPIASSLTMCNFLHHLSRYSIAFNPIFTAYTLSPKFPNCLSSLQQTEPTPSQVRNHYSEKNQEAHLDRPLALKRASNLHFSSNVCRPIICPRASYCRWLISPISLMKQDDDTYQDIGEGESEGESEDTRESTLSSDIEENGLDHQQDVILLGQACRDKSFQTTSLSLPKKRSRADTVIARPLLPNSRKPLGSRAPPLLKHQKSALFNTSSESDCAPPAQALLRTKSSGDKNAPQPQTKADQNVPQHQKATFDVAKRFIEAIVFTKTPWPILFDDKYSKVEQAWKLAIEAQDRQRAIAGAPPCTPSVCQLPSGPSLTIDLQTWQAVSIGCCLMLFYQIYYIDYAPRYT